MRGEAGETLISWLQPLVDRLVKSKRFDSEQYPKVVENSIRSGFGLLLNDYLINFVIVCRISYAIAGAKEKADRFEILIPYCGEQLHLFLRFVWNKPDRFCIDGMGENYDEVCASSGFFIDWERLRSKVLKLCFSLKSRLEQFIVFSAEYFLNLMKP